MVASQTSFMMELTTFALDAVLVSSSPCPSVVQLEGLKLAL